MHLFVTSILLAGTAIVGASTTLSAREAPAPAAETGSKPQLGSFGFDEKGMDKTVAPGDDFYGFADGAWAKATPIPADKSNYGMFTALDDLSKQRVREILEAVKGDANSTIGRAYTSYLDTATVEYRGLAPIQPWLNKVKAVDSKAGYSALVVEAAKMGISGPFGEQPY